MGWFGLRRELVYALKTQGAECDDHGNVKLYGKAPFVGLDRDEVVVPEGCLVIVRGRVVEAASLLNHTSYGARGARVF